MCSHFSLAQRANSQEISEKNEEVEQPKGEQKADEEGWQRRSPAGSLLRPTKLKRQVVINSSKFGEGLQYNCYT